jgi:hypothetical protein
MIAALYVQPDGVYADVPDIELWDEARDARTYDGPWSVVAHPPCKRWSSKGWHGSPENPHQFTKGDDGGCFAAALASVRRWGGVLEHPAHSHAWLAHGLPWPPATGWQRDVNGGWCCHVEQGFYGHPANKPTWLYAVGTELPALHWGRGETRLHPSALARHGEKKARKIGYLAMFPSQGPQRSATPPEFRDVLLSIAASAASRTAQRRTA